MLHDAHCHFFSPRFFDALARQRGRDESGVDLTRELGWDPPGSAEALGDRWVQELDRHGVDRAALIASAPGDEASVGAAVARHPSRLVGYFMLDASDPEAPARAARAFDELALRGLCLFPAMHHTPLADERVQRVVEVAAARPGTVVFVHCGALSIGVRKKLGLPSPFDQRLGDPLGVARLAARFPAVPFVVPHFGAGLFREALIAADTCANVYFDTSSSNGWIRYTPGLTLVEVFRAALAVAGPSRLLFGTDSSFFPRGWQHPVHAAQRDVVRGLGLGAGDEAAIFGGTFDRLFPRPAAAGPRDTDSLPPGAATKERP